MPKSHNARKQTKKPPMMTPKEKKAAKMAKKHLGETPIEIVPH